MRYVENYSTAGQATDDNIIRRMRFACWIKEATHTHTHTHTHYNTHTEYVIHNDFPRQQLLPERSWVLSDTVQYEMPTHTL
jgi:hypothetical protein